jgi:hypothetical protein
VKRTTVRRKDLWRVLELDGELVRSWLPGIEPDDRSGPLDRGGFERHSDALAFSLGVDHERAFHGHLEGVTTMDIDVEREALDRPYAETRYPVPEVAKAPVATLPPKVRTEADAFWDDLETELRMLMHRVA